MGYKRFSKELTQRIEENRAAGWKNPLAAADADALRRDPKRDAATLLRPAYVRDTEKLLHLPLFNRYADKTQVFSLYLNDDTTRRMLHVQLVSRIARSIGGVLGLNTELIEAAALAHDIGHPPFGHEGERLLSELLQEHAGRRFEHNVQSVRVLDELTRRNMTLQTLDAVLCHNGELEQNEYRPAPLGDFSGLDARVAAAAREGSAAFVPGTLEGCLVRVCDIIAYLGKDRQDAMRLGAPGGAQFCGRENAEYINNLSVAIIENSYQQDYIMLGEEAFAELAAAKRENYEKIYGRAQQEAFEENVRPMFREVYERLLADLLHGNTASPIYSQHIDYIRELRRHYPAAEDYRETEPNIIAADYIASMTDDYFVELYKHLFPRGKYGVKYVGYFG